MGTSDEKTKLLDGNCKDAGRPHITWHSNWTFAWIWPTILKGMQRPLEPRDIHSILPQFSAEQNAEKLRSKWPATTETISGFMLFWRLLRAYGTDSIYMVVVTLMLEATRLILPVLLGTVLDYITYDALSDWQGYTTAALLVMAALAGVLLKAHVCYIYEVFAMQARSAYSTCIYQKIFRLWTSQQQKMSNGNIINLLATDVEKVNSAVFCGFGCFGSMSSFIAVVVLLYVEVGWSLLIGLSTYGLCYVISTWLSTKYSMMRIVVAKATDERVQLMHEIVTAIRVIKMYCWEKLFHQRIAQARKREVNNIIKSDIYRGIANGLNRASSSVLAAIILITYSATGHHLTVSTGFRTMLFCRLWMTAMKNVLRDMQVLGQLFKSLERIGRFVCVDDMYSATQSPSYTRKQSDSDINLPAVQLEDVYAGWGNHDTDEEKVYQLQNISFSCKKGSLVAVAGSVGSGKSSLLQHILDEMPVKTGQTTICGEISFCPQEPWVFNDTLQQNILFGQSLDLTRYKEVLRVCGLIMDINTMPDGDLTRIGERGHSLSGGQKTRLSLARTIYREADIYLLDDPLSAVDTTVGRQIFESCIMGFLKDKTRILVTHQTQYLADVDHVIVLNKGTVSFVGTIDKMAGADISAPDTDGLKEDIYSDDAVKRALLAESMDKNAVGDLGWDVYMKYFRAGGVVLCAVGLFMWIATEGFTKAADWYLSIWLDEATAQADNNIDSIQATDEVMNMYIGLSATTFFLSLLVVIPLAILCDLAANRLHDTMFHRVMRAPTRFFDTNPVGIILNRFSRDLGFMDLDLPELMQQQIECILRTLTNALVVCVVLPWLWLVIPFSVFIFYGLFHFCMKATRDLKRLEAKARSPLYSHLSETLSGLQSIRILKMEADFQSRFNSYQDQHTMRWLMFLNAFRWTAMMMSLWAVVMFTLVVVLSLALKDEMSGAFLGLCLTYMLNILDAIQLTFRIVSRVNIYMTSVERILNYSELKQEAPDITDYRPPDTWPENGGIQFEDVSLCYYRGAPAALQNIDVKIRPKEKIGIVGRTGSGKSSLLQCLFRLTEPCGRILIDGIDVTKIGLHDLREKISVIPQDPVLFSGTMRRNLDPFNQSTPDQLWAILRKVRLDEAVKEMQGGLGAQINEGGSNLSAGQRQLVCLARALLKKNKIIILDEATANVDQETDRMIQVTIRLYFHDCTVLTVAHRLNTVMDCNRVMVLDQGKLLECDTPHLLLQNTESLLYKYMQQTGSENAEHLMEIAKEAYVNRIS